MALTFTSCGTFKRAGKDIFLGASTPVLMLYGGATDGLTTAKSIREGMGSGGAVQLRDSLHTMVIDEADLLLSYGYGDLVRVRVRVRVGRPAVAPLLRLR